MVGRTGGNTPVISPLGEKDLPVCYKLSTDAGWNQTADDWGFLLEAGNARCIRDEAGVAVATTVALPYPPALVWIGMVLVAPAYRGRGYARALMADALRYADATGLPPALDATPMGRPLYAKLGFQPVCTISRWRREAGLQSGAGARGKPPAAEGAGMGRCTSVQEAVRRDAAAVGFERTALFEDLARRDGTVMWCGPGGAVTVLRRGRAARHVGPVVAGAVGFAQALAPAVEHGGAGALVADSFDEDDAAAAALAKAGFSRVRGFARMVLGEASPRLGRLRVAAIAGPEYG